MKIRKPKIRITSKCVKVSNVGARIGGRKAGINISPRGVSGSVRSKAGSYNTRNGCSLNPLACCSVISVLPGAVIVGVALLIWVLL